MTTRWKTAWHQAVTGLALAAASLASHALALPQPPYEVDGFAMLYGSQPIMSNTVHKLDTTRPGISEEAYQTAFVEAVQPVMDVTGLDMSTLPVSFPNALREISLAPMSLQIGSRRGATFSNMVLDVRTMTIYGDLEARFNVPFPRDVQPELWYRTASAQAIPLFKATAGSPAGADYRRASSSTPDEPWWPADAPFSMGGEYLSLGTPGFQRSDAGPDTAILWLPNLTLTTEAHQALSALSIPASLNVGSMVIAVKVSAVPETSTLSMTLLGLGIMSVWMRRRLT